MTVRYRSPTEVKRGLVCRRVRLVSVLAAVKRRYESLGRKETTGQRDRDGIRTCHVVYV